MTCERNLCDGSGVVEVAGEEVTCNCIEGLSLAAYVAEVGDRPLSLAEIPDVDERSPQERLAGLGAPAWRFVDLTDAEPGPFVRTDLEEIPSFDPPTERVEALRAARLAELEAEEAA